MENLTIVFRRLGLASRRAPLIGALLLACTLVRPALAQDDLAYKGEVSATPPTLSSSSELGFIYGVKLGIAPAIGTFAQADVSFSALGVDRISLTARTLQGGLIVNLKKDLPSAPFVGLGLGYASEFPLRTGSHSVYAYLKTGIRFAVCEGCRVSISPSFQCNLGHRWTSTWSFDAIRVLYFF